MTKEIPQKLYRLIHPLVFGNTKYLWLSNDQFLKTTKKKARTENSVATRKINAEAAEILKLVYYNTG